MEPIWATAAKQDISFATFLWGRCDIAYEHAKRLTPAYCENYYSTDLTKTLTINVDKAVQHLMNGVDAAIVSTDFCEPISTGNRGCFTWRNVLKCNEQLGLQLQEF